MAGKLKLTGIIGQKAEKLLLTICPFLSNLGIPYVLEGGTLLGIIRENRLLPWDNDLDLTIKEEDAYKLLNNKRKVWKIGYRIRVRYYKEDIGPFKKGDLRLFRISTRKFYFFKDLTLLDIFVKKKVDNQYYWTVSAKNPVLKSVDAKFYENISTTNFKGKKLNIPQDYQEYLTCRYGNWQKAQKVWNFKKDDKAIVK